MAKKRTSKESLYTELKIAEDNYRSAFTREDGNITAAYKQLCLARDRYYSCKEEGSSEELKQKIAEAEATYQASFTNGSGVSIMNSYNELQRLKRSYFGASALAHQKSLMDQQCAGIIDDVDDEPYDSDSLI